MKIIKFKPNSRRIAFLILFVFSGLILGACKLGPDTRISEDDERLMVVATTTFIGDVVGNLAGDAVDLVVLLESGQNPHSYLASPQDMVSISEADLIFVNGFDLEEFLDDMVEGGNVSEKIVVVSEGINVLSGENDNDHDHDQIYDPHVWFDPENLYLWVENITAALIDLDPDKADHYQSNADAYLSELIDLRSWIEDELEVIPEEERILVSDHIVLGYFVRAFDFELIGAVIPAPTTEAETSGQQLAELIETISDYQARAIFVGMDFDPTLAQQVAEETGTELVRLYFGSLTDGPPAGTYLDFMRYNVTVIKAALLE